MRLTVQEQLGHYHVAGDIVLRSKIGLGVGDLLALHVGGVLDRWELLITGEPLAQMGHAEKLAGPGDVIASPEVWSRIGPACDGQQIDQGCIRLVAINRPVTPRPTLRPCRPRRPARRYAAISPGRSGRGWMPARRAGSRSFDASR